MNLSLMQLRLICLSVAGILILFGTFAFGSQSGIGVIVFGSDSEVAPFTIQNLMWIFFGLGCAELLFHYFRTREEHASLGKGYLIEQPGIFYNAELMGKVMERVHKKEDRLATLIMSLFMRYQASQKSTVETHEMLNSQLEMMQYRLEVDFNLVRYISWLIPTLGFIGTVVGISDALSFAGIPGMAASDDFLPQLTSALAVAFNTTLVALVMSAVLVYGIHVVQGHEERIIQQCGEYCLNNFINRLLTV